jgi:hypothetical protein
LASGVGDQTAFAVTAREATMGGVRAFQVGRSIGRVLLPWVGTRRIEPAGGREQFPFPASRFGSSCKTLPERKIERCLEEV